MKIILADNHGFCFGVKRAVDQAKIELGNTNIPVYSYGPLIHNQQATESLEESGLKIIEDIDEIQDSKIIIRSHGITKEIEDTIKDSGNQLIDCTCPYVKNIHNRVKKYYDEGYQIIIIGDKDHPEIIGINGWCNNTGIIINSELEAKNLKHYEKICLVSQTTYTKEKFLSISEIIKDKGNIVKVFDTICNATALRQEACENVAKKVDAMIVIGGYHSSNTNKLVEISKANCQYVYHIETFEDLPLQELSKFNTIGVTAGASTPDWIIKEVVETMDNLNNENNEEIMEDLDDNQMLEAIENSFTRIHRGEVVKGKVIFVTDHEVMVNINYKSDGIIPKDELSNDPDINPKDLYKEGDEISVYVLKHDDGEGNVVLSLKRAAAVKVWDELEEKFNKEELVEAKVLNVVKGGLTVLVDGINGFMPASLVSANYVSNLDDFKGQKLLSKIIDFDGEKRRLILSRKEVEQKELETQRQELWEKLEVGMLIEGEVARLTNFGAFVDLGGLDGLIHISDLAWHRVNHPSEVVKAGDKVEVQILAFDQDKNRISLGLKQTVEEPWEVFSRNVQQGSIVEGKVVNLLDFGAFVRLEDGVDGLLHVSQISKEHIEKPSDVLNNGDIVEVKVIEIDHENRRISLSMKDAIEESQEEEKAEESEELDITIEDMINKDITD